MSRDRDANDRDQYLWDKSGEPDDLVAALEARLAPLRHREAAPDRERLLVEEEATPPPATQPRSVVAGTSPTSRRSGHAMMFLP